MTSFDKPLLDRIVEQASPIAEAGLLDTTHLIGAGVLISQKNDINQKKRLY